jgi:hypothetical protein
VSSSDPTSVRIDLRKALDRRVVRNHWQDPTYAPYCLRCRPLERMKVIEPYLFAHKCGAVHDERGVFV